MATTEFRDHPQRRKNQPLRFIVEVHGKDANGTATRQVAGFAATEKTAIEALTRIMQQWSASEGAITPGTKVIVRDKNDGGPLLMVEYCGYGPDLITGR